MEKRKSKSIGYGMFTGIYGVLALGLVLGILIGIPLRRIEGWEGSLSELAALTEPRPRRVILTLNLPDAALAARVRQRAWPFELQCVDNAQPLGFGANHNRAFARDRRSAAPVDAFAVINPDIRLHGNPFAPLLAALAASRVGCVYPVQLDAAGWPQDQERRLPTPGRLLRRALARPYFLRSTARLSRVRKPACFTAVRSAGS